MAKIKKILVSISILIVIHSCTKYNYIDTGVANGIHDCSMWEYMAKQPYDWDSTRILIEQAGMREIFEGKNSKYGQITFLGVTNHVIRRYMLEHNSKYKNEQYAKVKDIPSNFAKQILEKLIIPKRLMVKDIPRGNRHKELVNGIPSWIESGGGMYNSISEKYFMYTFQSSFSNIQDVGSVSLYFNTIGSNKSSIIIVSSDIQTDNGIVHALGYDFRFTDL